MRNIYRWLMPAFWGIMILAGIRIATDFGSGMKFWEREYQINLIEIAGVVAIGYASDIIQRWFIHKNRNSWHINTGWAYALIITSAFIICVATVFVIHALAGIDNLIHDFVIATLISSMVCMLQYSSILAEFTRGEMERQNLQLERMKSQQLDTELSLLKSQYHPHFLFNALNTIYFKIDEDNQEARHTVEVLSNLLRYQLYAIDNKVELEKELEYTRSYIDLMKMRKSDSLRLGMSIDESHNACKIYPLLFQPLIENAFKYVGGNNRLDISLWFDEGDLCFRICNSVPPVNIMRTGNNGGIGLDNLRKRLDILYAGNYTLDLTGADEEFCATLRINEFGNSL